MPIALTENVALAGRSIVIDGEVVTVDVADVDPQGLSVLTLTDGRLAQFGPHSSVTLAA